MSMTFSGKVVLITGAGSGIGAATAKHFAQLDASLALIDRNWPGLEKVSEECRTLSGGKQPFLHQVDLTNETDTEVAFETVLSHYKKLDVLVNNAGIFLPGSIENTSLAQFDLLFNINVKAAYHLTMLAVPYLIASKGAVVNVSSVAGLRPYAGLVSYCMSKAAIDQFTKCVALELAPKGVRVNGVNPGFVVTNILSSAGATPEQQKTALEDNITDTPAGRPGLPEEIAKAIAFLASEDSSFSTGVCLSVDGGRHLVGKIAKLNITTEKK